MKFTTQQRVLVRMDLSVNQRYYMENSDVSALFIHDMSQYSGKVYTIASVNPDGYRLEGTGLYLWTDSMLSQHSIEFEVGARVKYVCSSEPGLEGRVGTVIGYRWNGMNLVEFDDPIPNGHKGNGTATDHGRDGHCWYCLSSELKVLNNETDEQKIVITTNGTEATATLYKGDKEIQSAKSVMPQDVKFDFMSYAKSALKHLIKEYSRSNSAANTRYPNGTIVCIENNFDKSSFTIGKAYNVADGELNDNTGFCRKLNWLNNDPTSGFCVYNTEDGPLAKFVVFTGPAEIK